MDVAAYSINPKHQNRKNSQLTKNVKQRATGKNQTSAEENKTMENNANNDGERRIIIFCETNEVVKKLFENPAIGEHWWKRYSRNLKAKDLSGYILTEIYQGQWKNGLREGKGKLTTFIDPAYYTKKDGTPEIDTVKNVTYKNGNIVEQ